MGENIENRFGFRTGEGTISATNWVRPEVIRWQIKKYKNSIMFYRYGKNNVMKILKTWLMNIFKDKIVEGQNISYSMNCIQNKSTYKRKWNLLDRFAKWNR